MRIVASIADVSDDIGLSAEELKEKYSSQDESSHPLFTRQIWRSDVAHQVTIAGYWQWVHECVYDASREDIELTW